MPRLRRFVPILLAILAACGDSDPSGPNGGSLAVSVSGLPPGTDAAITVTGPDGYRHDLSASETLTSLAPGGYTVAATPVSSGGQSYRPVVPSQTVTVSGRSAAASVVYGVSGGSLTINVAGLPPGASAAIHVSGPSGYAAEVTGSTTLVALDPGPYTLTAQSVAPGGTTYNPSPGSQIVNLTTGASRSANVSYTAGASGGFNLRIDGMYLTQSVQTYAGAIPLVKDRDGYLRLFVTANISNLAAPSVRVQFYLAGVLKSTVTIPPPSISVPLSPNEGTLASSWNVAVPKTLIQPGLSILADADPNNAVAEADETDNQFPSSGAALPMNVRATSAFSVSLVPVIQSVNGREGDVSGANMDSYLTATMKVHPLAAYDAVVRSPFTTSAPEVQDDNANGAWTAILSQLDAARMADPSGRYYYGVINPPYTSGVAGIGYIGGETAMGWDKNGGDWVAAHEWGHNWGRKHAPCGGAGSVDNQYPYADGSIGVYGLDLVTLTLKPPTATDIMGYCDEEWISDYTYQGVLAWREAQPDVVSAFSLAMQPCLLVWGRIEGGRAVLEPAFQVVTRPSLPARPGPYSVEGTDASGGRLLQVSFTPQEVADDPRGGRHFAFAVPLQADRAGRLAVLRLSAPGRPVVSVRAAGLAGTTLDLRPARPARGRVALRWNASTHPMLMVRDPASGQVLSFATGGVAEIATDRSDLEVQLSNGVAGRSVRVVVPR